MKKIIAAAIAALALAAPAFAEESKVTPPDMKVYPYVWEKNPELTESNAIKIYRTVDRDTGVLCYVTNHGGISCLNEPSLKKTAKKTTVLDMVGLR